MLSSLDNSRFLNYLAKDCYSHGIKQSFQDFNTSKSRNQYPKSFWNFINNAGSRRINLLCYCNTKLKGWRMHNLYAKPSKYVHFVAYNLDCIPSYKLIPPFPLAGRMNNGRWILHREKKSDKLVPQVKVQV